MSMRPRFGGGGSLRLPAWVSILRVNDARGSGRRVTIHQHSHADDAAPSHPDKASDEHYAGDVPYLGTGFWSLRHTNWPPLPYNYCATCDIYARAEGYGYLVDDRNLPDPSPTPMIERQFPEGNHDLYPPGVLWLQINWISNTAMGLTLNGTSPGSNYNILSKERLQNATWSVEKQITGATNQTWTPFQVANQLRSALLIWASTADAFPTSLSNQLVLQITGITNANGYFIIHPPAAEAATGVYDLFGATNLTPSAPGPNPTNWVWLGRTSAGQTNYVVANLVVPQGFFRLGTMLDSNADGVTDAYSNLVGLNSNSDLDGDGVSDVEEMREGRNPLVAGAIADTNGVARLDVFTVLR